MDLVNRSKAIAHLHAVNLLEPALRAVVVVKKTYAIGKDGSLAEADDAMPLVADQLITEFGIFHGELFFRKRGADVCVLGTARFDKTVTKARLQLEVGRWSCGLELIGDRVWTKGYGGEPVPSAPAPFLEMPLSYARAFGGTAEVGGEDVPWPDNPTGRGYYETPEQALGNPLPNIESSATASQPNNSRPRWSDRVRVAGWGPYPHYWGLRASSAVKYDPESGQIIEVLPELFNHAHPDLVLPEIERGIPVRVTGMGGTPLTFRVPTEQPRIAISVAAKVSEALGELDGIFVWLDQARLVVTWRARFRYAVRAEELRRAELTFVD